MMGTNPVPEQARQHIDFDSESLKLRLRVRFHADASAMSAVVDGIMKVVADMRCACGHELEIELSVREALANAIIHGAGNDPNKMVECRVACEETHGMLIIVNDPGDGFDPAQVPDPLAADNLYSDHGRGIFMINRLMDHVEYRRGGTEVHMRKFHKPAVEEKDCGLG